MKNRIGIDVGRKLSVEDAIVWASKNDVKYIDCQIDVEPNSLYSFTDLRCENIKHDCESYNIVLGLHTLSISQCRGVFSIRWRSSRYLSQSICGCRSSA